MYKAPPDPSQDSIEGRWRVCCLLLVKLSWESLPPLTIIHLSVGYFASEKDSSIYFWKLFWESNDRLPWSLIKVLDIWWTFQRCFSLAFLVSSSLQDLSFEGCIYFLERKAKWNKIHSFDVDLVFLLMILSQNPHVYVELNFSSEKSH